MSIDLSEARRFAESLAADAAKISHELMGHTTVEHKSDDSPVTEADRRIQEMFQQRITEKYPDHAFIGEETTDTPVAQTPHDDQPHEYCWIVDPIDGTRNFTRQYPCFASSVALVHNNTPVMGVIRDHVNGWTASGHRGGGVTCNGERVVLSNTKPNADTIIAVPSGRRVPISPIINRWVDQFVMRNVGSTALHLAQVACGVVDASFCLECKIWDVAAGWLLITESGGTCTDLTGQPRFPYDLSDYTNQEMPFLAGSPTIHHTLLSDMRQTRLSRPIDLDQSQETL